VWALRIHRWSTLALAVILVGHIVVASGVFPGYRGVWRSIHWRGEVSQTTAQRLWPKWTKEQTAVTSPDRRTD
jgi:formate dehydrogenase subunit gamma